MTDTQAPFERTSSRRSMKGWLMLFSVLAAWGVFLLLNGHAAARCMRQYQALLALDNVVERLSAQKKNIDAKTIKTVLDAELLRCDLAQVPGVSVRCARHGEMWSVSITDGTGGALARIEIPGR